MKTNLHINISKYIGDILKMAFIQKTPVTEAPGIQMPVLAHRWQLNFVSIADDTINEALKNQVTKVRFNFVKDEAEIVFEQPLHDKNFIEGIKILVSLDTCVFAVEHLNGGNVRGDSSFAYSGKAVDHEYILDYSESGVAVHKLLFQGTK